MKPNGLKATIGWCVATCLAIALAGCHGKDDDANSESPSGKAEHHATAPSRSESAPADSQPASQTDNKPTSPANKAPAHQLEKNGLTAADCTRSQWKRINCTNKGNSCIEKQIDQMGKYQRCKNAGLLEK